MVCAVRLVAKRSTAVTLYIPELLVGHHVKSQYIFQDGETVTFKCSADANPSDVTYKLVIILI